MKKKNSPLLRLKKSKISNLHNLKNIIGGTDTETGTDAALGTLNTACGASCVHTCETFDNKTCNETTRTLADNTFEETCGSVAVLTGVGC